MKPHIKRLGGLWYCAGEHCISVAFTPWSAYEYWLMDSMSRRLEAVNNYINEVLGWHG